MPTNRQLALKIRCLEIHSPGCTSSGMPAFLLSIRARRAFEIEVEFAAGETSGTITLTGDDVPAAELTALYDAINTRVIAKMTTEAPETVAVPAAFTAYEAGEWNNPEDGGDDASTAHGPAVE